MKSLKELLAERTALDEAIALKKKDASEQALRDIHALIADFGFTVHEVFPWKTEKKHVAAKYHDPASGATWTGRGQPPGWIAVKGRDAFLIKAPKMQTDSGPFLEQRRRDVTALETC